MKTFLKEKEFQRYIIDYVVEHNGFVERTDQDFCREYAMDKELLFRFLWKTQEKEMEKLKRLLKPERYEQVILASLNSAINKRDSSLLAVLKHGVDINSVHLRLLQPKPASELNDDAIKNYRENIFSIAEEVYANDDERVDLVVFLNGLAIMTFELKCPASGQTCKDAMRQYKTDRDPKLRLFLYRAGALVNFALDTEECYMTTRLDRARTAFLPFNRGSGKGISAGKGNSPVKGKYSTYYMWEDILRGDTIIELVTKFMFFEKGEKGETLIFPRYHQLDATRKILADVKECGTEKNYLIQHSAGSGKTNTIAWLAHRLVSLHDDNDNVVVDKVVIMTDRVVVDRQLQDAIMTLEHKDGVIKVMDDKCKSEDLRRALEGKVKIVATTIQKFHYIMDDVHDLREKRFAVIIDEAHSSTAGRNMLAVAKTMSSAGEEELDAEEVIADELRRSGKQPNVAMFAFTATPKPKTLEVFGQLGADDDHPGKKAAFHTYSMKQAIEEGFILDVLKNYTEYETYFEIRKKVEEDPLFKERRAKAKIRRLALADDKNINQRVPIIVEHFRSKVMAEVGGEAKAMVVTSSRVEAVKYHRAIERYIEEMGYADMKSLVAFSGKVSLDGHEFSEAGINGIAEARLKAVFKDERQNRLLVVADKYQTGYDEKRLCAMYVMKKLRGLAAVQTFSRLNRIYPPYDKRTYILDFSNKASDIEKAFAPYQTVTILSETVTPQKLYDLMREVCAYNVLDDDEIDRFWECVCDKRKDAAARAMSLVSEAKYRYDRLPGRSKREFAGKARTFVDWYDFVIQTAELDDHGLYKKSYFLRILDPMLEPDTPPDKMYIQDKISAENFRQELQREIDGGIAVKPKPEVKHKPIDVKEAQEDLEKRLSVIIEEINHKYGKDFKSESSAKSMEHIRETMLASEELTRAAKNNDFKAFRLTFMKQGMDLIADSYEDNKTFYEFLLNEQDAAKSILTLFARDVYDTLKQA